MFEQMVADLKKGNLPGDNALRQRFAAALVKKMGVIRTPYSFWPADAKINPPAKQLLWAAILLQDQENFHVVAAIIGTELEEKLRAKGQAATIEAIHGKAGQTIHEYLDEFIQLAPDKQFAEKLKQKINNLIAKQQETKEYP